ncbi:MAG: hypothetical protein ACFFDS_08615 [Candidatus Thorarchaeota archaeon]
MTAKSEDRMCKLTCHSFVCSKRMLQIIKDNGKKIFLCKMDDGECLGYMCNYAECRERKLSDSGLCLRPVKVQQKTPNKQVAAQLSHFEYMSTNDLDDKFKKKLSRKFK